jgi:hypothetical protein
MYISIEEAVMSHKNDPDYHDVRAKILLEAAQHLDNFSENAPNAPYGLFHVHSGGIHEAATELRRMASNARQEHAKVRDKKRRAGRKAAQ